MTFSASQRGTSMKIGWIGVGRMGAPMAARLLKAGYDVSIWNRTRAKAETEELKGAKVVGSRSELADVDVLFTMLSTGKDVIDVCFGAEGMFRDGAEDDAEDAGRLLDDRHGQIGGGARRARQAWREVPRGAGQRQSEMRARRKILLRRVRPEGRLRDGQAAASRRSRRAAPPMPARASLRACARSPST